MHRHSVLFTSNVRTKQILAKVNFECIGICLQLQQTADRNLELVLNDLAINKTIQIRSSLWISVAYYYCNITPCYISM